MTGWGVDLFSLPQLGHVMERGQLPAPPSAKVFHLTAVIANILIRQGP